MNFNHFLEAIDSIKDIDLPSINAQIKMAPLERIKVIEEGYDNIKNAKKAAVMMLFYPKNNITHLLLIIRNSYPGIHSSQIAFPGGKVEEFDIDLKATALRETHEEVGIPPEKVLVLRDFTSVYIPPSNFLVYPFLGISPTELKFNLQEEEVAGIIEMPLSLLLDDSIIVQKTLNTSYANSVQVPAFEIETHSVWGATAMMLSELKEALRIVL